MKGDKEQWRVVKIAMAVGFGWVVGYRARWGATLHTNRAAISCPSLFSVLPLFRER